MRLQAPAQNRPPAASYANSGRLVLLQPDDQLVVLERVRIVASGLADRQLSRRTAQMVQFCLEHVHRAGDTDDPLEFLHAGNGDDPTLFTNDLQDLPADCRVRLAGHTASPCHVRGC